MTTATTKRLSGLIRTTYIGATDFRGSRIKVSHGGKFWSCPYDDELSSLGNHIAAVRQYAREEGYGTTKAVFTSDPRGGYLIVPIVEHIEI